jgi:cell division protein FtsI/penicillin-binding protein 2
VFIALGGRLYYIQVICHERLSAEAEAQTRTRISLPAVRGEIVDRHGRRLAVSVPAYTLAANLSDIRDKGATAARLAALGGLSEREVRDRLCGNPLAKFVYIKRKLTVERARLIEAAQAEEVAAGGRQLLRGIHLLPDSRRVYVGGRSACHVMGFTQWDADRGDVGVCGVEATLDADLRGSDGCWDIKRDGMNRGFAVAGENYRAPVPGRRVVLTIDIELQSALESEITALVNKFHPQGAFGLIVDPGSGQVLAMASWPDFDPNAPGDCAPGGRTNRILTTVLEPGSTMKPLIAAGALEERLCRPEDKINCHNGSWSPRKGRTISDAHPYGMLTLSESLVKSSNIAMAQLGQKMGARRLEYYCRAFGFGRLSGLGLTGESRGILRPLRQWNGDSVLSVPFGHEISVTPLQLAGAYGAVANGGTLFRPQIVQRIEGPGVPPREFPAVVAGQPISRKTSQVVAQILQEAVERGTGKQARLDGWSVAGKTGTARKIVGGRYSDQKHFSSFVGFAPVESPRLVAMIAVDEPKGAVYGGAVAAPAVGALLGRALADMGVPRRDEPGLANAGHVARAECPP